MNPDPPTDHAKAVCAKKKHYDTVSNADADRRRWENTYPGHRYYPYLCRVCGRWALATLATSKRDVKARKTRNGKRSHKNVSPYKRGQNSE